MTKEAALKRVEELGGNKREGEAPMTCMPIMMATARVMKEKIEDSVQWNRVELPVKKCMRDCCKFEPAYAYENTREGNDDWDVMYMSCGYHD